MCIFIFWIYQRHLFYSLFLEAIFLLAPDNFILGLFLLEELLSFFSLLNLWNDYRKENYFPTPCPCWIAPLFYNYMLLLIVYYELVWMVPKVTALCSLNNQLLELATVGVFKLWGKFSMKVHQTLCFKQLSKLLLLLK